MERDEETGLALHGARYYAAWLGRWTAGDPIGLDGGINRYAYVSGNPITKVDPGGTAERLVVDQVTYAYEGSTYVEFDDADLVPGHVMVETNGGDPNGLLAVSVGKSGGLAHQDYEHSRRSAAYIRDQLRNDIVAARNQTATIVGCATLALFALPFAIEGGIALTAYTAGSGSLSTGAYLAAGDLSTAVATYASGDTLVAGTLAALGGALEAEAIASGSPPGSSAFAGGRSLGATPAGAENVKAPLMLTAGRPTTKTLAQVRRLRGKPRWQAAERYIQEVYGAATQRHYRVPLGSGVTTPGGRFVDAPLDLPSGGTLAGEVKIYRQWRTVGGLPRRGEVPLSSNIRQQILKDVWLRENVPGFDPKWIFVDAAPSATLGAFLRKHNIVSVIYR